MARTKSKNLTEKRSISFSSELALLNRIDEASLSFGRSTFIAAACERLLGEGAGVAIKAQLDYIAERSNRQVAADQPPAKPGIPERR